jgi:hypothetical protein
MLSTQIIITLLILLSLLGYLLYYNYHYNNETYGEYNKTTVGPDPFGKKLPTMKTRIYNYRNEVVIYQTLEKALQTIQPYEKLAICSVDNPIQYTRALQDIPQVIKFAVPYMERMLALRGLKLAKDPNGGEYIYKFVEAEGYTFPIGLWLYVEQMNSIL